MEDKKAAEILIDMVKKYPLEASEKEAISEAIGILSWSSLAQSRLKNLKSRRDSEKKELS
jgi:hypothetical protein